MPGGQDIWYPPNLFSVLEVVGIAIDGFPVLCQLQRCLGGKGRYVRPNAHSLTPSFLVALHTMSLRQDLLLLSSGPKQLPVPTVTPSQHIRLCWVPGAFCC